MNVLSWILLALITAGAACAAGHALLSKRDPRAALGWIAVCLMFPLAGPLLYFLFGFNRIRTRARKLQARSPSRDPVAGTPLSHFALSSSDVSVVYRELARIGDAVTGHPLVGGNRLQMMTSGEEVYEAMLASIAGAASSVSLATYIFESNQTGKRFVDALAAAKQRGVEVRVLVDGIGELYSIPRIGRLLREARIPVARFLPPRLWPPTVHINLRNHRKLLIVDGQLGFTGGMNIGDRHLLDGGASRRPVVDLHFRIEGPVVAQMEEVFLDDWAFATGHEVADVAMPIRDRQGTAICRAVVDGPDEDLDSLVTLLVGAISSARSSVSIMSPYFLPSPGICAALQAAALRGVEANVILPEDNNLPFVDWATRNMLHDLLRWGVRVFYQPPPFAHSKLFLVDDHYAQIGSANLDPRSLRLNFELVVEVYDAPFTRTLAEHFTSILATAREVTIEQLDARPIHIKARDATAWLFSPYL